MERSPGGVTRRRALVLLGGAGLPLLGGASGRAERNAARSRPAAPMLRQYYISADPVTWNYTPQGRDLITGQPFTARQAALTLPGPNRIGAVYEKSQYRRYTGPTFDTRRPPAPDEGYLGILGPVIRAQVGDTVEVMFRNNTPFPASMHPHGLFYAKADEGSYRYDGLSGVDSLGSVAGPGEVRTYTWEVPERAGPGPDDPSSVVWMYHDHGTAMGVPGTQAGLVGPIVVSRRGTAGRDGRPTDVDREVFSLFTEFDENHSPYLARNLARFAPGQRIDTSDPAFQQSNQKASINGYLFGNGPIGTTDTRPALRLRLGERVRWYVFALGSEDDLHTPHWHGNTVRVAGRRTDVVSLLPASMVTADMRPDDPGIWLLHCHVDSHMMAGMATRYQVT
ncbi:MAG TPA: multicopper oxidase domain-containing protein [Mycobacteriales bacterium]|nr:multicopper oxidase domain-containing protein [Mycobacteriales bacterium]